MKMKWKVIIRVIVKMIVMVIIEAEEVDTGKIDWDW